MARYDSNRRVPAGWLFAAILAVSLSLNIFSCSKDNPREGTPLLENMPPEFVRLLVAGDDSALAHFGLKKGFETLHGLYAEIGTREYALWADDKKGDARVLEDYLLRLAGVLAAVYGDSSYLADMALLRSLPAGKRNEVMNVRAAYKSIQLSASSAPDAALETRVRYVALFDSLGDRAWAATARNDLSDAYARLDSTERQRQYLLAAVAGFQELGRNKLSCEALGKLGSRYERWGKPDSMAICYDRALAIAYRHRMGYQAARIYEFYGGYYSRLGRLDIKQKLLDRAMNVARVYDSGCYEIRFLKEAMKFNAGLGCWKVVDQLITRVRGLESACENLAVYYDEINRLRTDVYEARLKMALGDTARADEIFRDVNRRLPLLKLPSTYLAEDDEYSYYRAEGLLANGRPRDALEEARGKLSQPTNESTPLWSARLSLIAAKAAYQIEEFDETLRRIADFDRLAVGVESDLRTGLSERDALVGMVALARGDTSGAVEAVSAGLRKLRATAESVDASVGSYLWLTDSDELRQAVHDVAARDDLAGYGATFYWHELYELLGTKQRAERRSAAAQALSKGRQTATKSGGKPFLSDLRSTGDRMLTRVQKLGAVHCVYLVRGGDVWRWTGGPNGVRRDVLPVRPNDLRTLVEDTQTFLSKCPEDPDALPGEPLRENLRKLAHALLPPEILEPPASPAATPLFLVTTDNFLGTIPFEAFDVGSGNEYEPLIDTRDVAYVRHFRPDAAGKASGPGVILVNKESSIEPQSRRALREAEKEGRALAALDSSAVFLINGTATKPQLTKSWEDAPYVYIAAHAGADELPYLSAVSLEASEDDPPDADVLDVTDIRSADLHRCELVVLSGCSSGLKYIAAKGAAPSLGDAFLDAGAVAVIHTFWDVTDDDARRIGAAFVENWRVAKTGEIRALADASRARVRGPGGVRHPFFWASYAITVSRL
jgi:hypothetical protein